MGCTLNYVILFLAGILSLISVHCASSPATFHLERVDAGNKMAFGELNARDRVRHSLIGVVDLPVEGSFGAYRPGLYFTRVKLGNPPKEFHLMIDTGSDVTWVNCISCTGCPNTSLLIQMSFYNPSSSSSAALVSCSDKMCHSSCSSNRRCTYSFSYEDGSATSGYYVSDVLYVDAIMANSSTAISSANIIFGCSTYESGSLTHPYHALDGVLGLGHQRISIVSQLMPAVFSHCLKGDGGGVLVLGQIIEPGIIYSPLDTSRHNYNLYLLGISISGHKVPIDPDVFARNRGTIVDSGTTLAYLAEEAYDPFVTALVAAVLPSVSLFPNEGGQCFLVSNSVPSRDVFPLISLNFKGGASMILKPEEYLIQRPDVVAGAWCVGFQKSQGVTILGDLVLKDKIIIYDLAGQRLGWADYNCSSSVSVASPGTHSSSSRLYPIATIVIIVYISISAGFLYLI